MPTVLAYLENEYVNQVGKYLEGARPYWASLIGSGGTLTNLESGMAYLVTFGNSGLESGCVQLQAKTYNVLVKHKPVGWKIARVMIGSVMEHHAVVVHEESKDMKSGFLFDPWVDQEPLIFTYKEWTARFPHYNIISGPKLE